MSDELPKYIANLRANVGEVRRLVDIHGHLTGSGPGRRHDVEVLNKSAVVLLVATWEASIEALAREGVEFLATYSEDPSAIPSKSTAAISKRLEKANEDNAIWKLAGEGWRSQLLEQAEISIRKVARPDAGNIDRLFEEVLGYRNMSSNWYWKGASKQSVLDRLRRLIILRNEIAHQVETSRSVNKSYVNSSIDLVIRLVAISGNRIRKHIMDTMGRVPWNSYIKGSAR